MKNLILHFSSMNLNLERIRVTFETFNVNTRVTIKNIVSVFFYNVHWQIVEFPTKHFADREPATQTTTLFFYILETKITKKKKKIIDVKYD